MYSKNEYYTYFNNSENEIIIALTFFRDVREYTYYYLEDTDDRLDYRI